MSQTKEIYYHYSIWTVLIIFIASYIYYYQPVDSLSDNNSGLIIVDSLIANNSIKYPALVMAISPSCIYCANSYQYINRLMNDRMLDSDTYLYALVDADLTSSLLKHQYALLEKHRIEIENLYKVDIVKAAPVGVPTFYYVDERGIVVRHWIGQVTDDRYAEILGVISGQYRN